MSEHQQSEALLKLIEQQKDVIRNLEKSLAESESTVRTIASPMKFTKNPLSFDRPPPLLGEHTAELSAEFGLGEATES